MGLYIIEQAFKDVNGSEATRSSAKRLRESTGSLSSKPSKKVATAAFPGAGQTVEGAAGDAKDEEDSSDDEPAFCGPARTVSKQSKGTGYAGHGTEDVSDSVVGQISSLTAQTTGQKAAAATEKKRDAKTAKLLRQVQVYLPQLDRESGATTGDHLVHPTTLAHLRRRSAFVNDLLRNDSLLDMSNRSELYQSLFDWLKVCHEFCLSDLENMR